MLRGAIETQTKWMKNNFEFYALEFVSSKSTTAAAIATVAVNPLPAPLTFAVGPFSS